MVKYNVNLKFKKDGKSLNEIIADVLKLKLINNCLILNKGNTNE